MDTRRRAVLAGLLLTAVGGSTANTESLLENAGERLALPTTTGNPRPIATAPQAAQTQSAQAQAAVGPAPVKAAQADMPSVPAQAAAPAPSMGSNEIPPYKRFAVASPKPDGRPIIAIVIDDLGVMHRGTERIVALPAPMTLSWFPFAKNLDVQVREAMERGHETTLHMPMQAFSNSTYQTGPDPLRIDLPPEVNLARLKVAMDAVPSTVGLNNHMGSVATKDAALMALVAKETKARGMLFLDSLTIGGSQGWRQAAAAGVPTDARDLFIDNSARPGDILKALEDIEAHARRHGNVIAIGHPRPHTLEALEWWMPQLANKGFVLWPLAATMALRAQENVKTTHV